MSTWFSGARITVVLIIILVIPLFWFMGSDHPLSSHDHIAVCDFLDQELLEQLPLPSIRSDPRPPGLNDSFDAVCYVLFDGLAAHEKADQYARIVLLTQRSMMVNGREPTTERYVETFFAEAEVDGWQLSEAAGPWQRGATMRRPQWGNEELDLMAEDSGIVLWIKFKGFPTDDLVSFAKTLAEKLRDSD